MLAADAPEFWDNQNGEADTQWGLRMKGNISIKDFISQVKEELVDAVDDETPFFELGEVELEVAFVLDTKAKAGARLFVVDVGGEATATQTHRVRLKLTPFVDAPSKGRLQAKDGKKVASNTKAGKKKGSFKRHPRYR
jgi:hypothetical protein